MYSLEIIKDIPNIDKKVDRLKKTIILTHNKAVALLKLYANDKKKELRYKTLIRTRKILLSMYENEILTHALGEISQEERVVKLNNFEKIVKSIVSEINK